MSHDKTYQRFRPPKPKLQTLNLTYYLGQGLTIDNQPIGQQTHPLIVRFLLACLTGNSTGYFIIPTKHRTRIAQWCLQSYLQGKELNHRGWPRVRSLSKSEFQERLACLKFLDQAIIDQWLSQLQ